MKCTITGTPFNERTVKHVLNGHSQKDKNGFQDKLSLNAGQKYCRMLQYLRPSFSDHLSLKPLFCLFLSGRFKQVLLYANPSNQLLMSIPKDVSNAYKFVLTFT